MMRRFCLKVIYVLVIVFLSIATCGQDSETVSKRSPSQEELMKASSDGDINKVKELVAKGADVNIKDSFESTPLHFALRKQNYDIAKLLIEKGADVNVKDKEGKTPLKIAIEMNNDDIANFLRSKGAKE